MRSAPIFAAESFGKSYGRAQILKAASVWGWAGSITVLLGRNGSGKSTLFRAAVGLISADYGVVNFRGQSYLRPRLPRLARQGLFYWPDQGLLPRSGSVAQHLGAVAWHSGTTARLQQVAADLEISSLLTASTEELSGGERRRVELALVLMRAPVCLLADEPYLEMSPTDSEMITLALKQLVRDGAALIITGHEVPVLMQVADEVVWMAAGTTRGLGTGAQAQAHDQFRREYLGFGRVGGQKRFPPA